MSRFLCAHTQTYVCLCSCSDFRVFMFWLRVFMPRLSCVHQTFVRLPDFRTFTRLLCIHSRLSCVHQTFMLSFQTFVRLCSGFRAFMFRVSCVPVKTFVHSCSGSRAFMSRLLCAYQTFVLSPDFRAFILDFRAFTKFSCFHSRLFSVYVQAFVRSCSEYRVFLSRLSCIHVLAPMRSCPDFRAFTRLSCLHQTFVRLTDFRTFTRLSCIHSRLSCVHQTFMMSFQTFVRSCSGFRAFMFRVSCVPVKTFVHSCSGSRAFMSRLLCVYQTFVLSPDFRAFILDFRAFTKFSCFHSRLFSVYVQAFVRSCSEYRVFLSRLSCIHVLAPMRSCPDFRAFTRLSCVHQTFVRLTDFRTFTRLS